MTFIPAPNIVRVELRATKEGQFVENRFHVNCFHTPTTTDLANIGSVVTTIALGDWLPLLPSNLALREIVLTSLQTENDIQLIGPFEAGTVGTASGDPLPNNNSLCISLRSGFTGRSARGRLYWMGLTESQVTQSSVNSTPAEDIRAAVDSIRTTLDTNSYALTIVSYFTNGDPRVGGPVYFEVNACTLVDTVIDSQRRRLPGRGA